MESLSCRVPFRHQLKVGEEKEQASEGSFPLGLHDELRISREKRRWLVMLLLAFQKI